MRRRLRRLRVRLKAARYMAGLVWREWRHPGAFRMEVDRTDRALDELRDEWGLEDPVPVGVEVLSTSNINLYDGHDVTRGEDDDDSTAQ